MSKVVEIRDAATYIPALAVQLGSEDERERYLLSSAGFGRTAEEQGDYIMLCKVNGGEPCECHIDPFAWGQSPRTMFVAHMYLVNRHREFNSDAFVGPPKHGGFSTLPQGFLVDVENILGISSQPKLSEQETSRRMGI